MENSKAKKSLNQDEKAENQNQNTNFQYKILDDSVPFLDCDTNVTYEIDTGSKSKD